MCAVARREETVLGSLCKAIAGFASTYGVDGGALLGEVALSWEALADPDARVPRATVDAMWGRAEALTGDRAFGVRLAAMVPGGTASIVEYVIQSAPTAGEAMEKIVRYWRILNDGADVAIVSGHGESRFVLRPRSGVHYHPQWNEFAAAVFVGSGVRLLGTADPPREVCVPHARADTAGALDGIARCPVRYGAGALEVAVPSERMLRPILSADAALHARLTEHAELHLGRLPDPEEDPFLGRIRGAVGAALARGDVDLAHVARSLAMSSRSLQRRLQELGVSHREVLDAVRKDLACRHLARGESVTDVAFAMGFSDASAFHRAFRRWTGKNPGEYVARAAR